VNQSWLENLVFFPSKNTDQTGIHQQTAGFFSPNFEFDFFVNSPKIRRI
jgi:hypothetical protein